MTVIAGKAILWYCMVVHGVDPYKHMGDKQGKYTGKKNPDGQSQPCLGRNEEDDGYAQRGD
jgi:hypothetical protein